MDLVSTLLSVESLTALITLSLMEIVLGIDNIIFISILVARLPLEQRKSTQSIGLMLALAMRIGLLLAISWIMKLTQPFFSVLEHEFSGRDLILLGGGLFLIAKSTLEIHHKLEIPSDESEQKLKKENVSKTWILSQIVILDIVFSLDSVITAIGMAKEISIMVIAMVVAMIVMLVSATRIGGFVEKHPSVKILALSFLLLIGVTLVVESWGGHVGKGYIYFAMFFSLAVEMINMRYRQRTALKKPKKV